MVIQLKQYTVKPAPPYIDRDYVIYGNWSNANIADQESFEEYAGGFYGAGAIRDFIIEGNAIKFNSSAQQVSFIDLPITEFHRLSSTSLRSLSISNCDITYFNPIGCIETIQQLSITDCPLMTSFLERKAISLKELYIAGPFGFDFEMSDEISNISTLTLYQLPFTEFDIPAFFVNLTKLYIYQCSMYSSVNINEKWKNLTNLEVTSGAVGSISSTVSEYSFKTIRFQQNQLNSVSFLGTFLNLSFMDFTQNHATLSTYSNMENFASNLTYKANKNAGFAVNLDSVAGTTLATILTSKGFKIISVPQN